MKSVGIGNPAPNAPFKLSCQASGSTLTVFIDGVAKTWVTNGIFTTGRTGYTISTLKGSSHRASSARQRSRRTGKARCRQRPRGNFTEGAAGLPPLRPLNVTSRGYGVGGAGRQPAGEFAPVLVKLKVALLLAVFEPPSAFAAPTTYWHEPLFWFPVPPLLFFFRLCAFP